MVGRFVQKFIILIDGAGHMVILISNVSFSTTISEFPSGLTHVFIDLGDLHSGVT